MSNKIHIKDNVKQILNTHYIIHAMDMFIVNI